MSIQPVRLLDQGLGGHSPNIATCVGLPLFSAGQKHWPMRLAELARNNGGKIMGEH